MISWVQSDPLPLDLALRCDNLERVVVPDAARVPSLLTTVFVVTSRRSPPVQDGDGPLAVVNGAFPKLAGVIGLSGPMSGLTG